MTSNRTVIDGGDVLNALVACFRQRCF